MKAITVKQPWASAIIHGGKDVENRTTNIVGSYRGPLAIIAGKQRDDDGWVRFGGYRLTQTMDRDPESAGRLGAIIGVVDLVDVHRPLWDDSCDGDRVCSPWAETQGWPQHLVLANPRPLPTPIPFTGFLGCRALPADVVAQIEEQLR